MPKTKTLRAAAKRFKISGSGHVVRKQACKRHLLTKKTSKRKRLLRNSQPLKPCDLTRIPRCLPNG